MLRCRTVLAGLLGLVLPAAIGAEVAFGRTLKQWQESSFVRERSSFGAASVASQGGLKVYPAPRELCLGGVFGNRCFEVPSEPEDFFESIIEYCADCTVLDVGANRGHFIDMALGRNPNVKIVAVEPHPLLSEALQRRFGDLPNVELHNAGLSVARGSLSAAINYAESADIYQAVRFIRSCADLTVAETRIYNKSCERIPVFPLDDIVDFKVNVLKIDVQGHELSVLLGGFSQFVNHGYDIIITELSPSLFESEAHARLYLKMLAAGGYRCYALQQLSPKLQKTKIELPEEGEDIESWPEVKKMRSSGSWADFLCVREGLEASA